jgi:hypothetical protein
MKFLVINPAVLSFPEPKVIVGEIQEEKDEKWRRSFCRPK